MINYLIYNIFFLLVLFLSKIEKKSIIFSLLLFIFIILFASFRFDVGPDYDSYVAVYYSVVKYNLPVTPDYLLFKYLSTNFSIYFDKGYIGVFSIYFSVTFLLLYKVLKDRDILFFGLFAFLTFGFFFDSLDRIRQALSIAIFLYALRDIENNNLSKYLFKIFIAMFIHISAVLLIPLYFLAKIRLSKVLLTIILILSIIINISGMNILLTEIIYSSVPYYSEKYIQTVFLTTYGSIGFGFIGKILAMYLILILSPVSYKLKTIMILGLSLIIIGNGNLNIDRFSDYLLSPFMIAFPLAMIKLRKKSEFIFLFPILIFFIVLFEFDISRNNFEYKSVFSYDFKNEIFEED